MRDTIGIRVTGTNDIIFLPEFLKAANDLMELITEIDTSTSPNYILTTDWKLKSLSYSSPATLTVEGIVKENQPDNRINTIDTILSGFNNLKVSDDRPHYFNDKALDKARELSKMMSNGMQSVEIISDTDSVLLTLNIIDHATTILKPGREIFGSVEGHIETLNSHNGFKFVIYESILHRRIGCELLHKDNLQLKNRVYQLFEHNVMAMGLLTTNIKGEVQSAKVDDIIDKQQKQVLKNASEVTGIYDISSDIDPIDYVRSLRG
jgi:hypothetical protein